MFRETGVDAVMIARSATGNPWLFREIADAWAAAEDARLPRHAAAPTSAQPEKRDLREIRTVLEEHLAGEQELQRQIRAHHRLPSHALPPDLAAVTAFRCHLFRYLHGLKGSSYVRGHLNTMRTLDDIRTALDSCFEREARYRAHAPWLREK